MSSIDSRDVDVLRNPRTAQWALWAGIAFSFAFTALIWAAGGRLDDITLLPDQGASWYYWKLPEATTVGRVSAWLLYTLHQVIMWGLIYYAQRNVKKYSKGLHPINLVALGVNAAFIGLHFIQTHLWYDGLAQDVSIWSSQWSVILLLVMVLLMENPRRGLFFGKKAPLKQEVVRLVRKYHGYIFIWAVVYTFWYHPMVATSGHLVGFFYMFLLMLQGSLFFTRLHVNRLWTFVQEIMVLVHGTLVAVMQGNDLWPMFFFGFAGIFIITQMHGLGLSLRVRAGFLAAYIAGVLYVYSDRGWIQTNEIIRIPIIEYLAVFVIAGLITAALWLYRRTVGRGQSEKSTLPAG